MRGLVQRVARAKVTVTGDGGEQRPTGGPEGDVGGGVVGEVVGEIGAGLCLLVGVSHDDTVDQARKLAQRVWNLRVMDDDDGVMNRSVAETTRQVLVVSQFTLYGDTSKGRRPSWIRAARPEHAEPLVQRVIDELRSLGADVATGRFRTVMHVELVNDGPTTIWLEVE